MAAHQTPATVWSPKGHRTTSEPSPEPGPEPTVQRHVGASRTHDSPEARGVGYAQDSIQLETPGFGTTETPDRARYETLFPTDPLGWDARFGNGFYSCHEELFDGGGKCDSGRHDMIHSDSMPSAYRSYTCNGCGGGFEGARWYCPPCKDDYCFNCRPKLPKESLIPALPRAPPPLPVPNCTIASPLDPSDELVLAQGESPWAAGASLTSTWSSYSSSGNHPIGSSNANGARTSSSAGPLGKASSTTMRTSGAKLERRANSNEGGLRTTRPTQSTRPGPQPLRRSGGSAGLSGSRKSNISSNAGLAGEAPDNLSNSEVRRQISILRQETEGKIASMQTEMQLQVRQQMQNEWRQIADMQREWMQRMEDQLSRKEAEAKKKGAAEAEKRLVDMLLKKKLALGEGQTPEDLIREILGTDYEGTSFSDMGSAETNGPRSPETRGRDLTRGSRKSSSAPNSQSPGSTNGLHASTLNGTDSPEMHFRKVRRAPTGHEHAHPDLFVPGSPPPFMPTSPPLRLRSDQQPDQRLDQSGESQEFASPGALLYRSAQSSMMRTPGSSSIESPRPPGGVAQLLDHPAVGSPIPSSRTCSPTTLSGISGAGTPAVKAFQSFEPPQPLRDTIRSCPAECSADASVTPRERDVGQPSRQQPREAKMNVTKKVDVQTRHRAVSSLMAPSSPATVSRETRSLSPGSPAAQTLASSVSQRALAARTVTVPSTQIHTNSVAVAYASGVASSVSMVNGGSLVTSNGRMRQLTPPTGFRTLTRSGFPAPPVPQNWVAPLTKTPHGAPPWASLPHATGMN